MRSFLGFTRKESLKADARLPVFMQGAATHAMWGETQALSMYAAQAERYTRSDLVYMCVNRIAEMAAMQQLNVFDGRGEIDEQTGKPLDAVEHPFLELWRRPNPWDSQFEFMESTSISLDLNGNAYWHLDDGSKPEQEGSKTWVRGEGPPIALWLLRPDRTRIKPSKTDYIEAYIYEVGGQEIYFDPSRIAHFKRYHPLRDFEGLSPLEALSFASTSDVEAQKTNLAIFKNSMRLSGVVESDRDNVSLDQIAEMEHYLKQRYTGSAEKAHQIAFLWAQFKYKELGMSMRDAEFIEGSRMNRMRIFGVYGIHPGIVFSEDVNLANARVAEYVTKAFSLAPRLERIAGDITPILDLWGETEAVARFVNVVPKDAEMEAGVAETKALALERIIGALGKEEGIEEAKRQGLISEEVQVPEEEPEPESEPFELPFANGRPEVAPKNFFRY